MSVSGKWPWYGGTILEVEVLYRWHFTKSYLALLDELAGTTSSSARSKHLLTLYKCQHNVNKRCKGQQTSRFEFKQK